MAVSRKVLNVTEIKRPGQQDRYLVEVEETTDGFLFGKKRQKKFYYGDGYSWSDADGGAYVSITLEAWLKIQTEIWLSGYRF